MLPALLPAIAEELAFRGVMQRALQTKYSGFVAIFFSTLLFVLLHGSLQQTVYQLIVGIMLGYLACVGGSVIYSIILHFLNNALVLVFGCFDIVAYLSKDNMVYYNIFSMIFPVCIFLLGVVLVGILFWVLKYLRNKNFFRYESKIAKKLRKEQELAMANQKKLGLKDMWKNTTQVEKVFMLVSIALIGIIWLILFYCAIFKICFYIIMLYMFEILMLLKFIHMLLLCTTYLLNFYFALNAKYEMLCGEPYVVTRRC